MQLELLSLLDTDTAYHLYSPYIKHYVLTDEVGQLVKDIGIYYTSHVGVTKLDWDKFKTWFQVVQHPNMRKEQYQVYDTVITNLQGYTPDPAVIQKLIDTDYIAQVRTKSSEYIEGKAKGDTFSEISDLLEEREKKKAESTSKSDFVDMDVDRLVTSVVKGHGIEWRLDTLNETVGQIHHSDFIVVCKRPETGGTSFMVSEFTYMLGQLPEGKDTIIFNNEEGGDKLALRIIQSALNITTQELISDIPRYTQEFDKFLGTRKLRLVHKPGITHREVERILKQGNYFLIGINVLDKIKGFDPKMPDVERRQHVAEWCRGLADKFGVVMGVVQAGDAGEGVEYMTQNMLYGSRTGVQGEIDILIMIGKNHDPTQEDLRFFSIVKNKKPITGRMVKERKHGKFPCKFDTDTGRYT